METKNNLTAFIEQNMKYGKIVFNKNPRNTHRVNCWSFVFVPVEDYDTMLSETLEYFKALGNIVVDHETYIEIDDMFAKGWKTRG
jgi:hypothetical protein